MCRAVCATLLAVTALWLAGCGGGGTRILPPDDGDTQVHEQGSFLIHTAASAGFRTVTLASPDLSPFGFMGFYGASIKQLAYRPMAGYLAYSQTGGDGHFQIYRARVDGSASTMLTNLGYSAYAPRWSPDGAKLLFLLDSVAGGRVQIMNSDGTDGYLVRNAVTSGEMWACWKPDGTRIAFVGEKAGQRDIYTCDLLGGNVVQLTNNTALESCLDWSPDGGKIAYVRSGGVNEIHAMDSNGGNDVTIVADGSDNTTPRFSPNGAKLAFMSDRDGDAEVFVCNRDGSNQVKLTDNSVYDGYPCWSPDGSQIMWTQETGNLRAMNPDGTGQRLVKSGLGAQVDVWAPTSARGRVVIGPAGTDYGGKNPPLGTQRPLAIVSFSDQGLMTAVTANIPSGQDTATIQAVSSLGDSVVGAKILAGAISNILADCGPGLPKDDLPLPTVSGVYPGAVLLLFSTRNGQLSSVIALNEQVWTVARPAEGLSVTPSGQTLLLRGPVLSAHTYSGRNRRDLTGGPSGEVVLDASTGRVLSVR
ncbi:MAG: hypothetical protein HPY69_04330 [Armatimonadetes bacterium]|nr:hypothetical protein [Armatimonadota bacterium]